jgi:hypothetical protein
MGSLLSLSVLQTRYLLQKHCALLLRECLLFKIVVLLYFKIIRYGNWILQQSVFSIIKEHQTRSVVTTPYGVARLH